jgi:hypothetical protein
MVLWRDSNAGEVPKSGDFSPVVNPERGKTTFSSYLLVDAFKHQFGRPGNTSD